jgi:hypothetical protein
MIDNDEALRHDRNFAQVVRLTPPPVHKQFAAERVRARIKERKARKKLRNALDRAEAAEPARRRVNPVELARVWSSLAFRDLRRSLTETQQERLRAHLAAYMAGETTPAAWHATVNAVAALRRASEPSSERRADSDSRVLRDGVSAF